MSTKKTRELLDWARQAAIGNPSMHPMVDAALSEVEALEKAAPDVASILDDVAEELGLAVNNRNAGSTNGTLTQQGERLRAQAERLRRIAVEFGR